MCMRIWRRYGGGKTKGGDIIYERKIEKIVFLIRGIGSLPFGFYVLILHLF